MKGKINASNVGGFSHTAVLKNEGDTEQQSGMN